METLEQKHTGTSANETNNSNSSKEELIKREEIVDTPFIKITNENGVFLTMGSYRLTDVLNETEILELEMEIKRTNWKFLTAVIGVITNQTILTYKGEL